MQNLLDMLNQEADDLDNRSVTVSGLTQYSRFLSKSSLILNRQEKSKKLLMSKSRNFKSGSTKSR